MKFLILANGKKHIKFLSEAYSGSAHDYAILKNELPPEERIWFDKHHLHVDLGFLGIGKDYSARQVSIPFKKSKNKPLTEDHKNSNKQRSSVRVKVEHSIGGLKRFRFLSDRLRCRNIQLYNLFAGVCAGLWNFCLTN
ncbi:MAG: transposase [Bacteroidetes bacterium]|nr:transposase [Bacteroidota bacterium]